jgi:hypothetical protein
LFEITKSKKSVFCSIRTMTTPLVATAIVPNGHANVNEQDLQILQQRDCPFGLQQDEHGTYYGHPLCGSTDPLPEVEDPTYYHSLEVMNKYRRRIFFQPPQGAYGKDGIFHPEGKPKSIETATTATYVGYIRLFGANGIACNPTIRLCSFEKPLYCRFGFSPPQQKVNGQIVKRTEPVDPNSIIEDYATLSMDITDHPELLQFVRGMEQRWVENMFAFREYYFKGDVLEKLDHFETIYKHYRQSLIKVDGAKTYMRSKMRIPRPSKDGKVPMYSLELYKWDGVSKNESGGPKVRPIKKPYKYGDCPPNSSIIPCARFSCGYYMADAKNGLMSNITMLIIVPNSYAPTLSPLERLNVAVTVMEDDDDKDVQQAVVDEKASETKNSGKRSYSDLEIATAALESVEKSNKLPKNIETCVQRFPVLDYEPVDEPDFL